MVTSVVRRSTTSGAGGGVGASIRYVVRPVSIVSKLEDQHGNVFGEGDLTFARFVLLLHFPADSDDFVDMFFP